MVSVQCFGLLETLHGDDNTNNNDSINYQQATVVPPPIIDVNAAANYHQTVSPSIIAG